MSAMPEAGCPLTRHADKRMEWGGDATGYLHEEHAFDVPMTKDGGASFEVVTFRCPGWPAVPQ